MIRFNSSRPLFLVHKHPGPPSLSRFCDAGVVLPDPLRDVRCKADVVTVSCAAVEDVDKVHRGKWRAREESNLRPSGS